MTERTLPERRTETGAGVSRGSTWGATRPSRETETPRRPLCSAPAVPLVEQAMASTAAVAIARTRELFIRTSKT
jgi:hypothetical protein